MTDARIRLVRARETSAVTAQTAGMTRRAGVVARSPSNIVVNLDDPVPPLP